MGPITSRPSHLLHLVHLVLVAHTLQTRDQSMDQCGRQEQILWTKLPVTLDGRVPVATLGALYQTLRSKGRNETFSPLIP